MEQIMRFHVRMFQLKHWFGGQNMFSVCGQRRERHWWSHLDRAEVSEIYGLLFLASFSEVPKQIAEKTRFFRWRRALPLVSYRAKRRARLV